MKISEAIISSVFPARCAVCDRLLSGGEYLCGDCKGLIVSPASKKRRCEICFMPLEDCLCGKRLFYKKLAFPFFNEELPRKAVHRLKFRHRLDLVLPFARLMTAALEQRDMLKDCDIITFVPMSRGAKFRRGYNQAQLLAQKISEISKIECTGLLTKTGGTKTQHSLNYIFRSGNPLGVYEPIAALTDKFKDKTVLIADDIVTSGATLNEAAKTLLIFGAKKVYCVSALATKKKKAKKEKSD